MVMENNFPACRNYPWLAPGWCCGEKTRQNVPKCPKMHFQELPESSVSQMQGKIHPFNKNLKAYLSLYDFKSLRF
jgi:hypothetical protein